MSHPRKNDIWKSKTGDTKIKPREGNGYGNVGNLSLRADPLLSRGPSKSSPGGLLSTPPARRVRRWGPFFRRLHLVLPCGAGVAQPRGPEGSGGARESRCFAVLRGHTKTEIVWKIRNDITTISVFIIKDTI